MILDEIVLHNFGVYAGRQRIELAPPSTERPVVLFGGLNGGGKTTLLDGLQLALYGKRAHCSNRGVLSHEEFLRRCIHRGVDPHEGAAVEVQFRNFEDGSEHTYRVHRSWAANGSATRERVEVLRDGNPDFALTEAWDEHMEDVIPSRIAHLFFFDGEQIESFADEQGASDLLATAIHSLLGLDLVDQLRGDLLTIERRKRVSSASKEDRTEVEAISSELKRIAKVRERLVEQVASAQTELDREKKRLATTEGKLKDRGGALFEKRREIEAQREAAEKLLAEAEQNLREFAAGCAPLLLVERLLTGTLKRAQEEMHFSERETVADLLRERDTRVLKAATTRRVPKSAISVVRAILEQDRNERHTKGAIEPYLNLSRDGLGALEALERTELAEARQNAAKLIARTEELKARCDDLDRILAGVPHRDAVASLITTREKEAAKVEQLTARVSALDDEIARVAGEHERAQAKMERALAKFGDAELASEDDARIVTHSTKVRGTLERFRAAVTEKHVARIQSLVLEGFRHLARKESLVSDLRINPDRISLELFGADQQPLTPDRLSAGERQLLAVSMLWGLARAAGRPLPAVIDTPLGRLDSAHRTHLVDRYFPCASHQVLLLSTDEEIDEQAYRRLLPRVGRSYRLVFDERNQSTSVEPGYFWE